ncbi:MFS transporter [Actinocrispum sp. NPDC049592]|uniref:MFS transporter n=1 Tax=Actinocrispum sp. NPDC049592 TaxID=3154835 RepID=UPI00341DB362
MRERLPREVWILLGAIFLIAVGYGVISPVLPSLAASFNVGVTAAAFVVSAFSVVRLAFAPAGGWLVAKLSEQPVYVTGLILAAAATAACAWASSYWQLLLFRSLGGIGSVMFTVSAQTLVLRLTPVGLRGRVSGMWATSFLLGNIAGPLVGGVVANVSTRFPFVVYGLATFGAAVFSWWFLRKSPLAAPSATRDLPELTVRVALRNRAYIAALFSSFAYGWSVIGVRFALVPLFVVLELHEGETLVGLALSAFAVGTASFLMIAGRLADRRGRKPVAIAGLAVLTVGSLAMGFAPSVPLFMVASLVTGIGSGLLNPGHSAAVADVIGVGVRGSAVLAAFQATADLGAIVGPLAAGAIADAWSYQGAFAVTGVVSLLSLLVWLKAPETGKAPARSEGQSTARNQAEPGSEVCGPAADTSSS